MKKERLDTLLVQRGFFESRSRAQAAIMAGQVLVNEQKIDKTGTQVAPDAAIRLLGGDLKYVSRGGLKLEKAVSCFNLDLTGKIAADIGASTGGFTDCALQNGAARVYAIDVGYGQLAWKLRSDERVVNMERTNVRYLKPEDIEDTPDFASVDVSFISLTKILLPARAILSEEGEMVCLIKPQFEAGRDKIGKKGVVSDKAVHEEVIRKIIDYVYMIGFDVLSLDYSPIKGPEGNIEYLVYIRKNEERIRGTEAVTETEAEEMLKEITEKKSGYSYQETMNKLITETVLLAHEGLNAGE